MGIATYSSVIAIGFCFPIICGILVAIRFYVRWRQKTPWGIDDWLCLPAWLFLTACCAALVTGVFNNAFVKQPLSSPNSVTIEQHILAQVTGSLTLFWLLSNTFIKLSILFFYRRIFNGRIFGICTWILMGLSILWLVYSFITWILYCGTNLSANFEGGWTACVPWGFIIQIPVNCLDTFIDFFLLVLPIPSVWRLQVSVSRKLIIVMIFLLGGFAFVAGLNNTIVQLVYVTQRSVETKEKAEFFQGSYLLVYTWPTIEIGVGLIACNLPSLSSTATEALSKQIRRGLNLAFSGVRHNVVRLSWRLDPRRNHTNPHLINTGDDGMTSDLQRDQDSTISNITLVYVESMENVSSAAGGAGGRINGQISEQNRNLSDKDKVISGFDAV